MSLLHCDGFDAMVTADLPYTYLVNGSPTIGAYGRDGTNGLRIPGTVGGRNLGRVLPLMISSFVVEVACYCETAGPTHLVGWQDGQSPGAGNCFFRIGITADRALQLYTGSFDAATVIWTSAPGLCPVAAWLSLQWKGTFHASTGATTVALNGAELCNLTGLNTLPSPNLGATICWLEANSAVVWFEDWWVLDQTGSRLNNFIGTDRIVECQTVSTGNGTHTDFTPVTGTDHGAMVDDPAIDGDSTYNASATIGTMDSYHLPNLARVSAVDGMRISLIALKSGIGTRSVAGLTRTGGMTYVNTVNHFLSGLLYANYDALWPENPATSVAWTLSEANTAEQGIKVTA